MIDEQDINRLKELFVTRQECDTTTSALEKKILEYSADLAVIKHQLDTITWLDKLVLGAVVGAIIAAVMTFILK